NEFPNAEVVFSEDLNAMPDAAWSKPDLKLREKELWHLGASDLCIVLDTLKGAGEEIAHFVESRFCFRLMILTHQRYQFVTTFPSELRHGHNQMFYTDDEY